MRPGLVEAFKFNVVVARLMELVNATRKVIDTGAGARRIAAVREAVEVIAVALDLFAPYTAEDMWAKLGLRADRRARQWRKADPTLLVEESVTAIVQVDGKVRDRLEVSPKISADDLEKLARASAAVVRSLGDREIVERDRARAAPGEHRDEVRLARRLRHPFASLQVARDARIVIRRKWMTGASGCLG